MISGEPGRSLSLGVVRSVWRDGLARWRGENARKRERERDGLQTERRRETNDGGERKNELNKAKQCMAFLSVLSHI